MILEGQRGVLTFYCCYCDEHDKILHIQKMKKNVHLFKQSIEVIWFPQISMYLKISQNLFCLTVNCNKNTFKINITNFQQRTDILIKVTGVIHNEPNECWHYSCLIALSAFHDSASKIASKAKQVWFLLHYFHRYIWGVSHCVNCV